MQRGNVGVIQLREELCFSFESVQSLFVSGELVQENFDRHIPTELSVSRSINLAHPAFADGLDDLVISKLGARGAACLLSPRGHPLQLFEPVDHHV